MKQTMFKTYLLPAILLIAVAATALAFVPREAASEEAREASVIMPKPASTEAKSRAVLPKVITPPVQTQSNNPPGKRSGYIQRARVWSQLRQPLNVLGDRLERKGRERVTLQGTINLSGDSQALPATISYEHKGRLRFEIAGAGATGQGRSLLFKEDKPDADLDADSQSIIETFLYDTAERFFTAHSDGHSVRPLGTRSRADDGTSENYAGPYYDIYQLTDQINLTGTAHQQSKLFFFNSDTLLLERVRYTVERAGLPLEVEVRFTDWRSVQGQRVPGRITRTENDRPVLTFIATAVEIGAQIVNQSLPLS